MIRASIAVSLMFMREVYWAVSRRLIFLCGFVLVAAALFLMATLFVLFVLRHDLRIDGARLYVFAGLIGIGAGLLSEAIQKPLRRDASWEDVFADSVGVVCALALFAVFDRRAAIGRG